MTTVLLVRHGETAWNRERRIQGWAPTPLTDRGREQAAAAGEAIAREYDVDEVFASDLRRTRETADRIARAVGVDDVRFDPDWRERDFGVLQGVTYDELDEHFPEYSVAESGEGALRRAPDRGESLLEVRERVLGAWERTLDGVGEGGTAVVVAHGGPIYLVLGHLKGLDPVASITDQTQGNCAINEIRIDGDGAEIRRENHTDGW